MTGNSVEANKKPLRTPELEPELDRIMREFDKSQPPNPKPDFAWIGGQAVFVEGAK